MRILQQVLPAFYEEKILSCSEVEKEKMLGEPKFLKEHFSESSNKPVQPSEHNYINKDLTQGCEKKSVLNNDVSE